MFAATKHGKKWTQFDNPWRHSSLFTSPVIVPRGAEATAPDLTEIAIDILRNQVGVVTQKSPDLSLTFVLVSLLRDASPVRITVLEEYDVLLESSHRPEFDIHLISDFPWEREENTRVLGLCFDLDFVQVGVLGRSKSVFSDGRLLLESV